MTTIETTEIDFDNEADLIRTIGQQSKLDTTLLTNYDRHRIWTAWQREVSNKSPEDALVDVSLLTHEVLEGRYRPFCPKCGSTNLIELRDATAYLPIRGAVLGSTPYLVSEEDPGRPPAIFETTELVRCEDCDFETENPEPIYSTAGLGAPEEAVNVFRPLVHVGVCQMKGTGLAALVHVFDQDWETWGRVAGPDSDTIPLTVTSDSEPCAIDRQLQIVADKFSQSRALIVESGKRPERDGDPIQAGDLYESICDAVSVEVANL